MGAETHRTGAVSKDRGADKLLGRYYTPLSIAQIMMDWAVTRRDSRILDPSFGGCSFFDASLRTLKRFGAKVPGRQLYGVDVDPSAREYLQSAIAAGSATAQFLTGDFLKTSPSDFDGQFDCVVGNPPYVRHHALTAKPLRHFKVAGQDVKLPRSANYWAYFVLHALKFVRDSGRLAFVLPSSFLFADYGDEVRRALVHRFGSIYIIAVGEHLFPDAEESSVLVLATGRPKRSTRLRAGYVAAADDLETVLSNLDSRTISVSADRDALLRAFVDPETLRVYDRIRRLRTVVPLSDIATIRIGVVTGCNRFFLLTQKQAATFRLRADQCVPTVARHANFNSPRLTRRDIVRLSNANEPVWLLSLDDDSESVPSAIVEAYLATGEKMGLDQARKCREREIWYRLGAFETPDAFLPCMSFNNTYLIYNAAAATSTNTIHHVFWSNDFDRKRALSVVTSSLSTLFALSAELQGRRYAGGLLKLEPSDAAGLLCIDAPLSSAVIDRVERLTRSGKWSEARELVDHYVLIRGLGVSESELAAMRQALVKLQQTRSGIRILSRPTR